MKNPSHPSSFARAYTNEKTSKTDERTELGAKIGDKRKLWLSSNVRGKKNGIITQTKKTPMQSPLEGKSRARQGRWRPKRNLFGQGYKEKSWRDSDYVRRPQVGLSDGVY